MAFVRDEAADETVRKDAALQDHIHARRLILWLPGAGAGVAVQGCLMLGGIGIAMSVLWYWPLSVERFKYYIAGIALGALPMALIFNAVVRGVASARMNMFRLSVVHALIAALETLTFLVMGRRPSSLMALAALAASLLAIRIVSGPGYALLAAIYRAQRAQLSTHRERASS